MRNCGPPRLRDYVEVSFKNGTLSSLAMSSPIFAVTAASTRAPSANVAGANDRIGVAIVGMPWACCVPGMIHLYSIHDHAKHNNVRIVAACDVFNKFRENPIGRGILERSQVYADYRKVLERRDVDAVVIGTHETLHARIALDALDAGKHVYCERPFTRYLGEAFAVRDKVKRTGKVFQLGVQGCSGGAWRKCAEWIGAGQIGVPVRAETYYCRNSLGGEWNYLFEAEATARNIDWDQWLGPVSPRSPFSPEHFYRWFKYYRYSAGLLSASAPNRLAPLMIAMGAVDFPLRVTSVGTHNVHSDRSIIGTPERDVPEHVQVMAEFPKGYVISLVCSSVNARSPVTAIYGHKGSIIVRPSGDGLELAPEKEYAVEIAPQILKDLPPEDVCEHEKNWFDCIRSGKQPNANIDLAIRVQTVLSLAEMADRLKITCLFDEKARQISDGHGNPIRPISYDTAA